MMMTRYVDALIVGAGFGGLYQLKRLRDQGFVTKVIDAASDVGGTWYWNRYPGAMSDTEAYLYRYSWDPEDLRTYPWSHHYVKQPEVLAYLQHIAKKHDLRKDIFFKTQLLSANWNDSEGRWLVETTAGDLFSTRYLITALGLLSKQNFPDIPGIDDYQGERYHTGNWPKDVSLKDKRVGIIGNGSTGVQIITDIAKEVGQLVCFQRNPQFSVPSGDGPVSPEYREQVNKNYSEIWKEVNDSLYGFGFEESTIPTMSVSQEERDRIFEEAWQKGGGFRFMFGTFNDIAESEEANDAASDFIKKKIREIVKDSETARKLMPTQLYARRPLCDGGYYEQFNRENVDLVSLTETPIEKIMTKGVKTTEKEYELDVLIFATGFDAVDGNYTRLNIKGRHGQTLQEHWKPAGPATYLGTAVPGFPNMFMITGPMGPFSNIPPAIEAHVEFISDIIELAEKDKKRNATDGDVGRANGATNGHANNNNTGSDNIGPVIEATKQAEEDWTKLCDELSSGSLFRKTESWIFGANVKGKKHAVMFYFGGLCNFRRQLREVAGDGYRGFTIKT